MDLGVIPYLEEEASIAQSGDFKDPFFFNETTYEPPVPQIKYVSVNPSRAPSEPPTARPPAPAPPRKSITLLYQGMMVRPDGQTVALIREQSSGRTLAISNGASLHGWAVSAITMQSVEIALPSKAAGRLLIGKPQSFSEE